MEPGQPVESTGIYSECPTCGAVVANMATHEAWHAAHDCVCDHAPTGGI